MADLRPTSPARNVDRDSTVAGTRPPTPKEKSGDINEKGSARVMTRTSTLTDSATVDGNAVEAAANNADSRLLSGRRLALVHIGFLTSILLVALDQTIVATALPKLASEFQALDQLTWVVSAYFLTQAGLMLTFGQILTIAPNKWVYLTCIILFEIGSLICGVAPNMNVLIFGRAFQGVGASGIFISILTLLSQVTRLEQRPLLFGSFGGVFALASVIGPLLGGVFTDRVTWRWCFYINLPFGAISVLAVLLFLPSHPPPENKLYVGKTMAQKWLLMDWVGSVLSVGMITSLLLPLQWGGVSREWNDRVVIALFVTFAVLFGLFIGWEWYKKEHAMMPLFLFKRRTQVGAGLATFFMMIAFLAASYYLPFFYQAKGRSAQQSGIDIIPYMLGAVIASFASGGIVNGTGHYLAYLLVGPVIGAVGAGLLFTIDEFTSNARLIGYQIIFGVGLGMAFQLPVMAIQAEYAKKPELIPQASSLLTFFQLLGGVIGIAIAGTIFNNQLVKELGAYADQIPPDVLKAVKQSVTVIFQLPEALQGPVVHAYVKSLDYVFIFCVPVAALTTVFALLIKNWNMKERGANMNAV
jgi:EmrB/QacA subfamily drug resistance transporter